jgi:Na+/proline symporter
LHLNDEGYILLAVFILLMATLWLGFDAYGRRRDHSGLSAGPLQSALELVGSESALLLFPLLPAALLNGGHLLRPAGLFLGLLAALLLGARFREALLAAGSFDLTEALFKRGVRAGFLATAILLLFSLPLIAACVSLLAELFFTIFSLARHIALPVSALLCALFALPGGDESLRRRGALKPLLLLPVLALLAAKAVQGNAFVPPALSASPSALGGYAADLSLAFACLGLPVFCQRTFAAGSARAYRRSIPLALALAALCLGGALLLGLFPNSGATGGTELDLLTLMQDGLSPALAGVLLCCPLALALYGALEGGALAGSTLTCFFALLFPGWSEGRLHILRPVCGALCFLPIAPLALLPLGVDELFLLALSGFAGSFGPLFCALALKKGVSHLGATLCLCCGAASALLWSLVPMLGALFPAPLPSFLAGFLGLVLGNSIAPEAKLPAREAQEES